MQMFILICITMINCAMLQGFHVSAMHGSSPRFGEIEVKRDWGQKTSRERLFQPMNDHQSAPIIIVHFFCMSTQNLLFLSW